MKLKKGMRTLPVLLALLLGGVVLVPGVSADGMPESGGVWQPAWYDTEKYTVRLVDANITQDQIFAVTQRLLSSFENESRNLPPRFIGTAEPDISEDETIVAYVFRVLPGGESLSYAEVVFSDDMPSREEVSSRVDAWMNGPMMGHPAVSPGESDDLFGSDNRQPIHSATLCRTYPGIGQAMLATTWYWDDRETNAEQDYFFTQTTLTTRPGISMPGCDPYRNYRFNVEINSDYSLDSYPHLPDVRVIRNYPQTSPGFTTHDFSFCMGGFTLRCWLPGIPDSRVTRHHPYDNVYNWDKEWNIWSDGAVFASEFSPGQQTYCSQSARDGNTYSVSRVKADVSDGWFAFHDGLPRLGPSGTHTLGHFGKVRWSNAGRHDPGSAYVTVIPMKYYPVSEDEARAIALDDPEIQEKIQGYTIRTEVRRGQMGLPDANASHIVSIHVFDPETGQHLITHLVPVRDDGEIMEKYYLNPSKIPPDLPQNLT